MDRLAIKITETSTKDVSSPSVYYNRKGFFALNMQGLYDHRLRLRFVSVVTPGSSHDSIAYQLSNLDTMLDKNAEAYSSRFWIVVDSAYVCSRVTLTPRPRRSLPIDKGCFNYCLSSARITIWQAFGVLAARWGILWRPWRVSLGKASQLVTVCCKLHNFITDHTEYETVPINKPSDVRSLVMEIHLQD